MLPRQLPARSIAARAIFAVVLLSLIGAAGPAEALEFFASPSGSSSGDGSVAHPWDLVTALKQPAALKSGDTLWLRGGVYKGEFVSYLNGASGAPIVVRSYPGERATIDGVNDAGHSIFQVSGAYTWYRDFEIMSSNTNRTSPSVSGWGITTMQTPGHPGLKLINLVIHDTLGNGFWIDATDMEMYGCIVYYNGYKGTDRGHGHGIYAQNATGTKRFTDNIVFQQFDKGMQFFGGTNAPINNMDVEGNTVFQNGYIDGTESNNIEIGGGVVAQNPVFKDNYSYYANIGKQDIGGYNTAGTSNLVYQNNYDAADNDWPTTFSGLHGFTISGNTFRGHAGAFATSLYPSNSYYLGSPPPAAPNKVFIRPNAYEPGRANVTVYNWSKTSSVSVDLSSVLKVGDVFEVRNAQNFFGAPVLTGTYGGGAVVLPMSGLVSAAPAGWVTPASTGPEFNVFVVRRVSGSTTTTSTASVPDPHFSIQPSMMAPAFTTVKFVDTSLNKPTSWLWSFGDPYSTANSSTLQNPSHVFGTKGWHTVRLTVRNAAGSASTTNTIYIY